MALAASAGEEWARVDARGRDGSVRVPKRTSASRPSGEWSDEDFDVLADGAVVGRIMKVHAAPVGSPWMWTLAFGGTTRTARRRTAAGRRGRSRWRHSRRGGGGSDRF